MKVLLSLILMVLCSSSVFSKTVHLDEDNTIPITGAIDDVTVVTVIMGLAVLNEQKTNKPIYLYIDSPGGDVVSSMAVIAFAKSSRRPVHTVTVFAASAAFNIVQALGTRYISSYAVLLTHNAYFTHFSINDRSMIVMETATKALFKIYQQVADRLKMSLDDYLKFMSAETFVRGENNIKINTADKIVDIDCSRALILNGTCSK